MAIRRSSFSIDALHRLQPRDFTISRPSCLSMRTSRANASLLRGHFENQAVPDSVGSRLPAGDVACVVNAVEARADRARKVVRLVLAVDQQKRVVHTLWVDVMSAEPALVVEAVDE